jgi:hypothetical protein
MYRPTPSIWSPALQQQQLHQTSSLDQQLGQQQSLSAGAAQGHSQQLVVYHTLNCTRLHAC